MSRVTAPSDRRFRRAHVKPARRRRNWTALVKPMLYAVVLGAAGAFALYRGSRLAAESRLLRVDRIIVRGNERLSKGEVLAVLSGLRGENLLLTDLDAWRRRLLASPWVSDAALRRSLPSTVEVVISERTPIGIARLNGGEMYLVDARGVIVDQFGPQYADFDLPIIDGLSAAPGSVATAGSVPDYSLTDEGRAELATRVMAALRAKPQVAHRVSQVDVTDAHNASVILTGDPAVIELGEDQFLPRLEAYLDLASTLRDRVENIDYVDLRFDDRIYVRPLKATGAPKAVPHVRKK